jgi:hypothetical protein
MKKMVFSAFSGVFVLGLLVSGCAPLKPLQTPSGKPEVTIPDVAKKEAVLALTDIMIEAGYITKTITDDNVHYYKRGYGLYASPVTERGHQEKPEAHVSYDITETGGGVRIVATMWVIVYPQSPLLEKVYDVSRGRDAHDIQMRLERLKASFKEDGT